MTQGSPDPEKILEKEEPHDKRVVEFEGPNDAANPVNWSRHRKWAIVILLSAVNLIA